VRLAEHNPDWDIAFAEANAELLGVVGSLGCGIEHVGSTSVSDLPAKPILDIVVGVPRLDLVDNVAESIERLGYLDRGYGTGSVGRLLIAESEHDVRTVHLHIVEHGSNHWHHYVAFRDALRTDPELRRRYEAVKRQLAARFSQDRVAYTDAKAVFVRATLATLQSEAP